MLKSVNKLQDVLANRCIREKPVLVVATKADRLYIDDSLQLYDIENAFQMEQMARKYSCAIKLCYSHLLDRNVTSNKTGLLTGFKWLIHYILVNYDDLQTRLQYDRNIEVSRIWGHMSQISVSHPKDHSYKHHYLLNYPTV